MDSPLRKSHPCIHLREELIERGLIREEGDTYICSLPSIDNELLQGKRDISLEEIRIVADATGIPYSQWLKLWKEWGRWLKWKESQWLK